MLHHLSPGPLVRHATWWLQDYAYAAVWQVRAVTSPRDPERYLDGTGRPVLVIPGVWETWAFLRPMIERLHAVEAARLVAMADAIAARAA